MTLGKTYLTKHSKCIDFTSVNHSQEKDLNNIVALTKHQTIQKNLKQPTPPILNTPLDYRYLLTHYRYFVQFENYDKKLKILSVAYSNILYLKNKQPSYWSKWSPNVITLIQGKFTSTTINLNSIWL